MNNVLVEVFSEATLKKYEFWLPKNGIIKDVIEKLAEDIMIFESNDSLYTEDSIGKVLLISKKDGRVFNQEFTVVESGIMSGDYLILV